MSNERYGDQEHIKASKILDRAIKTYAEQNDLKYNDAVRAFTKTEHGRKLAEAVNATRNERGKLNRPENAKIAKKKKEKEARLNKIKAQMKKKAQSSPLV